MTKKLSTPAVNALTIEQAHELIHKLLDRITELEDRLNQHSGNSSKPPSSNGPGSTPPVAYFHAWRSLNNPPVAG